MNSTQQMAMLREFVDNTIPKVFKQLEHLLKKNNNGQSYFVHDKVKSSMPLTMYNLTDCSLSMFIPKPSFPEFTLFHLVNSFLVITPSALKEFHLMEAWLTRMSEREGIKKYLSSGRQLEMINGSSSGQKPLA